MVYTVPFSIRVYVDPALTSLNRNKGNTPGARYAFRALQRRAYDQARHAWGMARQPTVEHRVRVDYMVRRGRKLDDDNILGGLKKVRDALFNDGITPHDSQAWFEFGTLYWETGDHWIGKEEVIVVVTPLIDEPKPKPPKAKTLEEDLAKLQQKALRQMLRGR